MKPHLLFTFAALALAACDEPGPQRHVLADEPENKCLDPYDRTHAELVRFARVRLHSHDSFVHRSTTATAPDENGVQFLFMSFNGTNAFGAVITNVAQAQINHETCKIIEGSVVIR